MIRLAVSVEGPTEREFVKKVLAEHLRANGAEATPVVLGRARGRDGGGNVSAERLASEMVRLSRSFAAVTSLVDFYGFKRKGNDTPDALQDRVLAEIKKVKGREMNQSKMLPYVQQHEFESLLFSNPDAFAILNVSGELVQSLWNIRSQFANPEDINDHSDTAPGKRIEKILPRYNKVVDGPLLAVEIGLATIRAECPRFGVWLTRLESMGTTS